MSSLREQEQRMREVERMNFDLKMQVYYLQQKINNSQNMSISTPIPSSSVSSSSSSALASTTESSSNGALSAMREENVLAKRRIEELELEVVTLKAQVFESSSRVSNDDPANSTARDISNRSKERIAVNIIAENDTIVITQLEKDIEKLKQQHFRDVALLENCMEKLDRVASDKIALEGRLHQERGRNTRLQQKISLLADRIRREELTNHSPKPRKDDSLTKFLTDILTAAAEEEIKMEKLHAEDKAKEALAAQQETQSAAIVLRSSSKASDKHDVTTATALSTQSTPQDFLDFGSNTAWSELHSLRREVKSLRHQLRSERELFKSQEEALKLLQKSFGEKSKLEATEIQRLELELDKALSSCESWEQKYKVTNQQLRELRSSTQSAGSQRGLAISDEWDMLGQNSSPNLGKDVSPGKKRASTGNGTVALSEHNKIVEMYRKRESELLQVLESMVVKCAQLEEKPKQRQAIKQ